MSPKEVVYSWVAAYNDADAEALADLYASYATYHRMSGTPTVGKDMIKEKYQQELADRQSVLTPENVFEDGEWAILEWYDEGGHRGCSVFHIIAEKIVFQRGYALSGSGMY